MLRSGDPHQGGEDLDQVLAVLDVSWRAAEVGQAYAGSEGLEGCVGADLGVGGVERADEVGDPRAGRVPDQQAVVPVGVVAERAGVAGSVGGQPGGQGSGAEGEAVELPLDPGVHARLGGGGEDVEPGARGGQQHGDLAVDEGGAVEVVLEERAERVGGGQGRGGGLHEPADHQVGEGEVGEGFVDAVVGGLHAVAGQAPAVSVGGGVDPAARRVLAALDRERPRCAAGHGHAEGDHG